MATLARGIRRLGLLVDSRTNKSKSFLPCARYLSTLRCKIVDGPNGEKIIPSPYGEISIVSLTIPEYVWKNVNLFHDKIALECGLTGRKYTYAEARDGSNYVARSLLNMGFKSGDIIALIMPNIPEYALALLGVLEAGLVATTINPYCTDVEASKQLISSDAKGVILCETIAPSILAAAKLNLPPNAPIIVVNHGSQSCPEGTIPFKDLLTKGKCLPPVPSGSQSVDNLAILPYSSGTTGFPKGVMLTHKNLVTNMEMSETTINEKYKTLPTGCSRHVTPVVLPFFHIYGLNAILLPRLSRGEKIITLPTFTPETFANVMEKHKPTILYCVPTLFLFCTTSPLIKKHFFDRMRVIFIGAAPIHRNDIDRFYEKVTIDSNTLRVCQGYGLTETCAPAFFQLDGASIGSIGVPIRGSEVRLVDPITNEDISSPGKPGELWIRGPHIMKGYYKNEIATQEVIEPNGWLRTGDVAYFDKNIVFFIVDRLKELIKVKGFQVSPAELEALLRTHPDIEEAAVIGISDTRTGEVPKAFVVSKNGKKLVEEDIKNFVKKYVSEYKQLKGGVTFIDSIPKNASGKILRSKLKLEYTK